MKKIMMLVICAGIGVIILSVTGCTDRLSKQYYKRHPMSSDDVAKIWGNPVYTENLEDGIERKIYTIQNAVTDLKYRYFLVKDGKVIASGITDRGPGPGKKAGIKEGFTGGDLSKAYYKKFPMTLTDLERVWGEPAQVQILEDETQRRVYEIAEPFTDFSYRYFLLKDDMVIASRISPDAGFNNQDQQRTRRDIKVSEISNAFYKKHPMTIAQVEKNWGKASFINERSDGLQLRIYKIKNPYPAGFEFRYFIVDSKEVISSGITDTVDLALGSK
ncbi:MAG: hypothetical protein GY874_15080 [Desulfobacteraceae bacterium]|nr:hypothetical protein [Desulfobacteraceae bacterium]